MRRRVWTTVRGVLLLVATATFVASHLRRVEGRSMQPTLLEGEVVAVLPPWGRLRVGDLVIVRDPRDRERQTVKRVVAVTGDWADLGGLPGRVPPGHLAVEGDDPAASTDSRHYGAVPAGLVVGRVLSLRPTRARAASPPHHVTANGVRERT